MLAALLLLLLITASVQVLGGSSSVFDTELAPSSKWTHCIEDGWANIRWSVHASGKLTSGVQLPSNAQACQPSKTSSCKWLVSCDSTQDCSKSFPGELSGRKKCVVVVNTSGSQAKTATIQIQLESPGNRGAIIFGVASTTFGLLAVVAAGCYSDLKKLAAGDKHKRKAAMKRPAAGQAASNWQLPTHPNGHAR